MSCASLPDDPAAPPPPPVAERLASVRAGIARAAREVGRDPSDVTLVAVSKTIPADGIQPALAAGQRVFGENYVQEAVAKWTPLRAAHPDLEVHMIGPLQSNKAREAVALFDVIQTLDRPSLAAALAREVARAGRQPRLFVQVNTGEEPQKGGVLPADLGAFLTLCRDTHGLAIEGLMCIPPVDQPPSAHFAFLRQLAREHGLSGLSMGMSGDYEPAIMLGATHVRVGSAIFGARG